jgi:poly(A) polymerase
MARIEAEWLTRDATQRVFSLLGEAWAVGGCVRNTLLGVPVKDIDISTPVRPEDVMSLAEAAGLRAVPTGIEHGTVTIVIDGEPYEVTTFRHDVETDGRRAVVAFADRIEDDARRRDFTMNALYADASGDVADPVGGLDDLAARRVRFIEDAEQRIREDYLRSLRFFRFSAFYGDGFDPDALDAIARNLAGLVTLSRERVGSEILRLLEAPDPAPAVAAMRATGVLGVVLPGADDRALAPLVHMEATAGVAADGIRRLAVLGGEDVPERLRLSRNDAARLKALREAEGSPGELGYCLGAEAGRDALLVRAASSGVPVAADDMLQVAHGATQVFPVTAADLMPDLQGPALGAALKRLEQDWVESGFTLSREALLGRG